LSLLKKTNLTSKFLVICTVLNLADYLITRIAERNGLGIEGNPLVALLTIYGPIPYFLFKLITSIAFVWLASFKWDYREPYSAMIAFLIMSLLAIVVAIDLYMIH